MPRTGYGVKSDEATYVAMALSVAYDGDLTYEKRDLERFAGLYHSGPNGIFLKRGKHLRVAWGGPFPFVRLMKRDDTNPDRLYYGKAFIYPLLAAPFVRLYGLNGLLIVNVLLLALAVVCAYAFLTVQSPPVAAALFTSAFFGAAALPVYGAFLMPDIFNLAIVLLAYFLWLYKEVRLKAEAVRLKADTTYEPTPVVVSGFSRTSSNVLSDVVSGFSRTVSDVVSGFSRTAAAAFTAPWTDFAAAVLLGVATYSKPVPVAVLVAPLVALAWWRRRWTRGFAIGTVAVAAAAVAVRPERRRHRRVQLPGGRPENVRRSVSVRSIRRDVAKLPAAGHRRSRPGGASRADQPPAAGPVRPQHRVFSPRPAFRVHPVLLSRLRRHRRLARVAQPA